MSTADNTQILEDTADAETLAAGTAEAVRINFNSRAEQQPDVGHQDLGAGPQAESRVPANMDAAELEGEGPPEVTGNGKRQILQPEPTPEAKESSAPFQSTGFAIVVKIRIPSMSEKAFSPHVREGFIEALASNAGIQPYHVQIVRVIDPHHHHVGGSIVVVAELRGFNKARDAHGVANFYLARHYDNPHYGPDLIGACVLEQRPNVKMVDGKRLKSPHRRNSSKSIPGKQRQEPSVDVAIGDTEEPYSLQLLFCCK